MTPSDIVVTSSLADPDGVKRSWRTSLDALTSFGGEGSDFVAIPFSLSTLGVVNDEQQALVIGVTLEGDATSGIGTSRVEVGVIV
ncbi:hypothetical protein Tco_0399913 [Tanacetum coccineum]